MSGKSHLLLVQPIQILHRGVVNHAFTVVFDYHKIVVFEERAEFAKYFTQVHAMPFYNFSHMVCPGVHSVDFKSIVASRRHHSGKSHAVFFIFLPVGLFLE